MKYSGTKNLYRVKKQIQGSLNSQYVYTAFNDFFIQKGNCINVVFLDINVIDTFVTQARGGIYQSTPTGSTAYCLSAGGQLILNRVLCIALVPICPL